MLDENSQDRTFHTVEEVVAYSKFFLGKDVFESQTEIASEDEWEKFQRRRQLQLDSQIDFLNGLDLTKANKMAVDRAFFRLSRFPNPLASIGSDHRSTRFNYKEISSLKNRVVYLGKTAKACIAETFHLEYQKRELQRLQAGNQDPLDLFVSNSHFIYEFHVQLENVLVLTSPPCWKAIHIKPYSFKNEFVGLNEDYIIPSSSQILGTLVKNAGFDGILFTSVRAQTEQNLVVFEENVGKLEYREISRRPFTSL